MTLYEKLIPTSINESVITRFLFSTRIAAIHGGNGPGRDYGNKWLKKIDCR